MFPFSLTGRGLEWLEKEVPPNSLTTWDQVTTAFLRRFYNDRKTAEARSLIQGFRQKSGESLSAAWERYKELQLQCPHHGIPKYQLIHTFYGGLTPQGRTSLDAAAGGTIMNKGENEVECIIEEAAKHYDDWYEGERDATSSKGVYALEQANTINNLSTQISKMTKQMDELMKERSNPHGNTSPSTKGGNVQPPSHEHDGNMENLNAMNFAPRMGNVGNLKPNSNKMGNWNQGGNRGWNQSGGGYDNQYHGGGGPSNFNGRGYSNQRGSRKVVGSDPLIEEEPQEEVELENEGEKPNEPLSVEKEKHVEVPKEKEATPLPLNRQPREEKLPFPQLFVRAKLDAQFGKFLELIKNLNIFVPFVDAMKQMPHYSKFLKDLLSGRRECEMVSLTANCSAILSNKLPTKLKDPGNFSIPCSINGIEFDKALYDLGASMSLMPYSVYQKLSVGTLSPTNITLQIADRSVKFPMGKVEDIPLREESSHSPWISMC
ncbi:uncharacterized protein LOC110733165 [Chenopodium quinoa]|uniref:uncharacterized protein LOC110733165 n=1 Tax=Chenopodium quinoa TaxID=63459 RepID=UPI000B7747F5|nr:uncharacterized protein LOC110733165 [Chenopodium quinoa]